MLERQHGEIVVECDTCDATLATDTADFDEARDLLKAERWRTYKEGDVWCHACPGCRDSIF